MLNVIDSSRLRLVAATLAHVCTELDDPAQLSKPLGAIVPASWPPGEYDRNAMDFFKARFQQGGPEIWQALTDPKQLREWAPFDADRSLDSVGPVSLSTVGAPTPVISGSHVSCADAPNLLEYQWGDNDLRWQLEPLGEGTRLTLWHRIDRRFICWGAAGWHICLDVLAQFLAGEPIGRIVGGEAMQFDWQRLVTDYAKQFNVEPPIWPAKAGRA